MQYVPRVPPAFKDLRQIRDWLEEEQMQLAQALTLHDVVQLRVLNVVPTKPREGMVVFADGTNWNPGAGKGAYVYNAGAWRRMD